MGGLESLRKLRKIIYICTNTSNSQLVRYEGLKKPWYLHERKLDELYILKKNRENTNKMAWESKLKNF